MKTVNPKNPVRADHRMIKDLLSKYGEDVQHIESEYGTILRVFAKMGGSWAGIYKGSPDDIVLLKKICKKAVKIGVVSKGGFKPSSKS